MNTPTQAIIAGEIVLPDLGPKAAARLERQLLYPNPEYRNLIMRKLDTSGTKEWLSCVGEFPGFVTVPRGAVAELKAGLDQADLSPAWLNKRVDGAAISVSFKREPRGYQIDVVNAILEKVQGIVVAPCGSGKTVCAILAICKIGRRALVLVHTQDLLDQWVTALNVMTNAKVSTVESGKKTDWTADVVVAMVDTFRAQLDGAFNALAPNGDMSILDVIGTLGVCIVDEAHRSPNWVFQEVLKRIPAKYRIGFTATPERADGTEKIMFWTFGPKIYEVETAFLVKHGYLVLAQLEEILTDFEFKYDGSEKKKMAALTRAVAADVDRNALVAKVAKRCAAANETTLVLTNNKKHCRLLGELLAEAGVPNVVLVGSMTKKERIVGDDICPTCKLPRVRRTKVQRRSALEDLREGTVKVAIATSLADEGLDVPRLHHVILALPGASRRATQQQVGRAMRPYGDKRPKLWDLVDDKVETLARRFRTRKSVYKELGLI